MTEETQTVEGVAATEIPLYVYGINDDTAQLAKGFYYLIGGFDDITGEPLPIPNPFETDLIVGPYESGGAALEAGYAKIIATKTEMDAEDDKQKLLAAPINNDHLDL